MSWNQAICEQVHAHGAFNWELFVGDLNTACSVFNEGYTQVGAVDNEVFSNKRRLKF